MEVAMKSLGLAVLGLALIPASAALAQTTVTREVSDMPVETTITRSPTGTMIQRRVLAPEQTIVAAPARATRTVTTTVRRELPRTAARPTRIETRVVTRRVREPAPVYAMAVDEPVMLTPGQRDIVYREIVTPRAVAIGPTGPLAPFAPLLPQPAVTYAAPATTVSTSYVVGSRLPADIRLTEIPQSVVMQVPSIAPYAYARVDGRLLLVDPQTGMIVADVTD
jgi:hypothetical protein